MVAVWIGLYFILLSKKLNLWCIKCNHLKSWLQDPKIKNHVHKTCSKRINLMVNGMEYLDNDLHKEWAKVTGHNIQLYWSWRIRPLQLLVVKNESKILEKKDLRYLKGRKKRQFLHFTTKLQNCHHGILFCLVITFFPIMLQNFWNLLSYFLIQRFIPSLCLLYHYYVVKLYCQIVFLCCECD